MKSSPFKSLEFQIGNMEYEEYLANYLLWCAFFVAMVIVLISFVTISLFASSLWVEVTNLIKAQLPSFVSNFEDFIYRNRDVVGEKHSIENLESHLGNFAFSELYQQPSKVAVLTGGSRGIGLHVLKKLLQCEITVILGRIISIVSLS